MGRNAMGTSFCKNGRRAQRKRSVKKRLRWGKTIPFVGRTVSALLKVQIGGDNKVQRHRQRKFSKKGYTAEGKVE